jgi:hypothetical protein
MAIERLRRDTLEGGEPRWRSLLASIRALQMELKRTIPERNIGLAGNPAAPESAIMVAELRLGRRLPPSYREFLAFSDGWPHFFEETSLLGTRDIGRAPARRTAPAPAQSSSGADKLLAFGTDQSGATLFAFDASAGIDGELPVIAWLGGLGLSCTCFTAFLATVLQLSRAELASAKNRSASPAAARFIKTG